jgi:prepilin-type N-terminal cleavage/methylation domain-containing protein
LNTQRPAQRSPQHRPAGFTLIELMVTVAIVGILTAIAYPSYRNYVLRGQIVNATNGLSALQANMERFFQDNRTYVGGPCTTTPPTIPNFTMTCTTGAGPDVFVLTATGAGPVNGFVYTINQLGTQTSTVSGVSGGWSITCSSSWETKAGTC